MENIKTLIQENKDCKMEKGVLCAQHCRDCRYMEMENDHYNDGNRRCALDLVHLIIVRPLKILRFQMEYRILIIFHFRAVIHCKALRFLLV